MKLESFTKQIFKSSLISAIWTNLITIAIMFFISQNLFFKVYNNQFKSSSEYLSNYINRVSYNDELYEIIREYENRDDTEKRISFYDLEDEVTRKTSYFRGVNTHFNKREIDPKEFLKPEEYAIYSSLGKPENLKQHLELYNEQIYILDIKTFKNHIHFQFFNLSECKSLKALFLKEGFLGYYYNGSYKSVNTDDEINKRSNNTIYNYLPVKNELIDSYITIPGFSFLVSSNGKFYDNLLLFIIIFGLSIFRILTSTFNSRRNIKRISKPLDDLVKNTEKLASHEVCEKLNRFDYPYIEFKKLAEAFNKVLLSRELSEIKLFRSFEQMESVVHKRTQELITANEQLTNAIKKAEEANAAKSQFLANISHEIRTPLNCIIGFCDIILTESHNEVIISQIGQILHESETLLHLINDFLDYSKIDAGKMTLVESELNVRSLISSLLKSGQIQAGEKPISLETEIADNVPSIILSDELRLYQVISNIFYNAIKFTQVGSVTIKVDCINGNSSKSLLEIRVIDTGIGIPEDRINTIFDKFEQVDGSLTRNYRGSGLGLTICKKIIELMQGTIEVDSKLHVGSTFTITIPVTASELKFDEPKIKKIKKKSKEHVHGSRILLVEDYPVNQIVAKKHLEMDEHIVEVAENGLEAVQMCQETVYDLILMDLQMPIMDGFRATKEIRSKGKNQDSPILAMTANAMETAKQTCLDTGMDGVITKPIRKKVFLKEVDKWLKLGAKEEITSH